MGPATLTLDDYRRQFPATSRVLALHHALRPLLSESPALAEPLPLRDTDAIERAWQHGRPIIEALDLHPKADALRGVLRQVTARMRQHLPALGPIETLADPHRLPDAELLRLADDISGNEPSAMASIGQLTGANPTGAAFAMAFAISVFYHAVRRYLPGDLDLTVWQRHTCPVCAGTPAITRLNAQGNHMAFCHRCSADWQLPADVCGGCGIQDGRNLLKLELPGSTARWVEICRSCKHTIKVVDERSLGAVCDLYFEDVVTMPLDDLAREAAANLQQEPALGTLDEIDGLGRQRRRPVS